MSEANLATTTAPRTYAELRRRVQDTLLMGKQRIEQTKVRTYWETGRLIDQHLLVHKERAKYGGHVIGRLAVDVGISTRILYQCVQFARVFPIVNGRSQLTWGHYRVLTHVEDRTQRKQLEVEAVRKNWTSEQLEERIRPLALGDRAPAAPVHPSGSGQKPLAPKRGTIGVYRIDSGRDTLTVDLGFTSYLDNHQARQVGPVFLGRSSQADVGRRRFSEQRPARERSRRPQGQLRAGGLGSGDPVGSHRFSRSRRLGP